MDDECAIPFMCKLTPSPPVKSAISQYPLGQLILSVLAGTKHLTLSGKNSAKSSIRQLHGHCLLVEVSKCETSERKLLLLALLASDELRMLPGPCLSSMLVASLEVAPPTGLGHDRHPSVDCTLVCNLTVRACRCPCESLHPALQLVTPSSLVVLLLRRFVDRSWNTQALDCTDKDVLIRRPEARLGREYGFTLLCSVLQEGACSLSTGGECLRFWSCCYVSETFVLVHLDLAETPLTSCSARWSEICQTYWFCLQGETPVRSC